MSDDPYATLGVSPSATDAEVRKAYRRLVQLHHPDHNHGSEESTRRFEAVQDAFARIRELRAAPGPAGAGAARTPPRTGARPRRTSPPPPPASDPEVQDRLADLERRLREAREAREARLRAEQAARRAAREASSPPDARRASDEELGYIRTDDSFAKILGDAREALFERLEDVRERPDARRAAARAADRAADLIDELGARLRGERPRSEGE